MLCFSTFFSLSNWSECTGVFNLCTDVDKERLARQAVKAIHEQMDDDKDGMIGRSESTEVSLSSESKTESIVNLSQFSLFKKN